MSSRAEILDRLKSQTSSQGQVTLPEFDVAYIGDPVSKFKTILGELYTDVIEVNSLSEVASFVTEKFDGKRMISNVETIDFPDTANWKEQDQHLLENVEFALFEGTLGVAENGAIWISDEQMGQRVAPFICQRLGIILKKSSIVPLMQQAYKNLDSNKSSFGTFISGPSKTADIEQSLVVGAHGSRELFVFLM
ncbi:LutC/YkgG family protein [Arcticibacterium luteifluviistationis]|uniref:Lactate utilization protein B/C n=1 Tax=Arcticibacterium luteifluviistationis TaxID=1784714 RepID=A0A2Z4GF13_9BACT|nr:LUD domain-containing protein [Arcticibacterium luteifluviistationis]AWV99637.1 lactate utilization protein B/C [Arcticibacterium luteifluviistationis]